MHCVKSVDISFSGPYSVQMRENTGQKSSEYGHFLRSDGFPVTDFRLSDLL